MSPSPFSVMFRKVAQYEALWGGQLLPKPMFEKWLEMCVFEGKEYKWSASCDNVEQKMDSIVGELPHPEKPEHVLPRDATWSSYAGTTILFSRHVVFAH